jgi:hypothetical protein
VTQKWVMTAVILILKDIVGQSFSHFSYEFSGLNLATARQFLLHVLHELSGLNLTTVGQSLTSSHESSDYMEHS